MVNDEVMIPGRPYLGPDVAVGRGQHADTRVFALGVVPYVLNLPTMTMSLGPNKDNYHTDFCIDRTFRI
jgi:hypothetical protein